MTSIPATVILLFLSISSACASTLRCPGYLLTNSVMAHPYDITKYYKCHESRYLIEMQCSRGMEFNSHRAICIKSANYVEPIVPKAESECECPTQGPCPEITTTTTTTLCPTNTPCTCPTEPGTPTPTPSVTPTPTPCPVECKDGEREITPIPPTVTPSPPDYCESGEEDVDRPIITTPLPC